MAHLLWLFPFFLLFPQATWAFTVAEIQQNPTLFDQQSVTVTGEAANVVTRYGEATYTMFDLVDKKGAAVSVLASKTPHCKQGERCRISGLFVAEKNLILPEKIEKISEGAYKTAGVLFRQRRSAPPVPGGRAFRGFYIPQ
jgi:hypothetical protein